MSPLVDSATDLVHLASHIARITARPGATADTVGRVIADILSPYLPQRVEPNDPAFRSAVQALLQETSADHRARQDQYRDLLDVVADMSAIDQSTRLHRHVAEQARRLLHADVTYLWLSTPEGEHAYLGAASGELTSELRDLRIPAREAMTGKVIETGLPLIVARYLDDDAFTHHTKLDQAVREERITAAAAVPLPTGPRIIGALIAANRDERTFSLSDVELLRILGAHAALAIDRVAVAEERDQALMSLQSDNLELTRGQAASVQVHNTLARVLLTGTQLSDLVTGLVEIIEGQLAVFDRDVRMLAEAGGFTPTEHTDELVRSAAATHLTQTTSELAAVPVTTTTGLHGVLCLRAPAGVTRSDIQVIERAVVTAAILLLRAEAEAGAAGFRRDDFINDLVSGKENPAHLMQRAAKLKFDVRSPYTIHVVRADLQDRRIASLAHEAARPKNGLAGLCHRMQPDERPSAVVLLPGEDARKNSLALAEAMRRASDAEVSVAGAGPVRGGSDVRRFFEEAHACSDAMLRLSGYRLSGTMDDLGFLGLVLGRDKNIHAFVEGALAPVVNYDAEHRTELLHTLDALLSTDGGPTAAAELLHVHVSTVKQRMQRLQRLLGDDWRSVDRTLELRLAMKLHRIGVGASS